MNSPVWRLAVHASDLNPMQPLAEFRKEQTMHSIPADLPIAKSIPATAPKKSTVTVRIEPDGRTKRLEGRAAWMMRKLVEAGKRGVTPLDLPTGVRVAHYIFLLRREGFIISTEHESHGGPWAGQHARYRLETPVTIVDDGSVVAA
ncbi:hypothetical protein ACFX5Q_07160 [Mesorhizobium sp. IMUNJ 23033]|uniref:winged helix domain-containing protein n=1 Tax=Mesorhizobium sp. IMUNJ 23033 TaxID=3378039 RepID=UPI0038513BF8